MREQLVLYINGRRHVVRGGDAFLTLSEFLRIRLRQTGTKIVCSEGDCGSCSVLVGRPVGQELVYRAVDSCIQFLFQLDGSHVVTVEGLQQDSELTPVQQAMVTHHGSQCGYCTPGFVVAMTGLLEQQAAEQCDLSADDWRCGLTGNLCRCTGYASILAAGCEAAAKSHHALAELYPDHSMRADFQQLASEPLTLRDDARQIVSPVKLTAALDFLAANPGAKIVAGATDVGVQVNKRVISPGIFLDLNRVTELTDIAVDDQAIERGARTTWSELETVCREHLPEFAGIISIFGSPQIRHAGTIGGNIVNASPIADSLPLLFVAEAQLEIAGARSTRTVNINDFYHGYRKTDLKPGELLTKVRIPLPTSNQHLSLTKVSRRRDLDIATFTAAILLELDGQKIADARIALGAVGPTVLRTRRTEAFLRGKILNEYTMQAAGELAVKEITPISDVRGSADFRWQLACNVFLKVYHELAQKHSRGAAEIGMKNVGKTIAHDSAVGHVTGSAPFIEDLPLPEGALLVGFLASTVACGKIVSLDITAALQVPGVVAIFTAADIPGHNYFGPHFRDEPVLADGEVLYVGQPIVAIAAESQQAIVEARARIAIKIEQREAILSIERSIELKKFIGPGRRIHRGNATEAMAAAPRKLSGVFQIGGQEQFYLESQAAIAYPGEQGQVTVHSSTQNPTEIQHVVAEALGVSQHQVVCICKRMGGGFGGKETQAAIPAVLVALVAQKTGRAARIVYTKDEDMCSTGKRHAYRVEWEAGFDLQGVVAGVHAKFYSNGGASADLSLAVLERTLLHFDNAYYLPHVSMDGQVCFTNLPSNTAFRGFGGPQGMAAIENILHEIAHDLGLDPYQVQLRNVYGVDERNVTPYGQIVSKNHLPEIMATLAASSQYRERRQAIEAANREDRLRLRGIAMMPMKFGISFTTKFLNQGNALVNVYTDGTVQVSTGATEMGQGVNTKIRQLVADEFGLDYDRVVLMPTSTEKNPNTSPTAASASADLNGTAAVRACGTIKERLAAFAARRLAVAGLGISEAPECIEFADGQVFDRRNPEQRIPFGQLCKEARLERIDLGARGFYATPGVDFNRDTGRGTPFLYYTQGAAVAEIEIDRFTGDLRVPRVDLLIDIGQSINPGVDRGQVIGGFIQGMGWVTAECLVYNDQGALLSHSPTTYKIPAITDLPPIFNCEFFENDDNVENVARSKAVGEPPLMLAICVWTAVKQALRQSVKTEDLRIPATGEEILRQLSRGQSQTTTIPEVDATTDVPMLSKSAGGQP